MKLKERREREDIIVGLLLISCMTDLEKVVKSPQAEYSEVYKGLKIA